MAQSTAPSGRSDDDQLGKARPRIQDVARRAGVVIGTVSNVLNHHFVRNSAARTLAARRTDTVGLVLTNIGNSLFVDIARGAESAARDELGGYLAASHLLDQGARRLVYLAGFLHLRAINRRLSGIRKVVAAAGASLEVVEAPNLGEIRQPSDHPHRTIMLDPHLIPDAAPCVTPEGTHVTHLVCSSNRP